MDKMDLKDLIQGVKEGLDSHTTSRSDVTVEFELCIAGDEGKLKVLPSGNPDIRQVSKIKFQLKF